MTRDEIIALAREAGIVVTGEAVWKLCELVAAAERERCAKIEEQLRLCNVDQLTTAAELAEANARLDWLDTVECGIQHKSYGEYWHYIGKGFPKAREVIDAAMKEKNT